MSHFKTTLGIALSIFWALPFNERDEEAMRKLGYKDAWIRWMKVAHDQNTRTLVTHEIAEQAAAIGQSVDEVYEHNDMFRHTFREILPDRDCKWTNHHKFQKRLPGGGDPTTGTYEYRGVGQALQGIHANNIIQDDNFGRAAQNSLLRGDGSVCRELIGWHKQVGTRFDPIVKENRRQLVIGNAWGHADLNAWIKKHQPEFKFETHSAEGGCCKLHPEGVPILPEEWTIELLHKEKARLEAGGDGGAVGDYEHFYLNLHTLPWEQIFKSEWLRYYKCKQSRPELRLEDERNILLFEHDVYGGEVIEDLQPGMLNVRIIVDPHHANKVNRSGHVIWVIGYDDSNSHIYLMDLWCENTSYSAMVDEMYRIANRWQHWRKGRGFIRMGKLASELLAFPMQERARIERHPIAFTEFDDDPSQAAQKNRIESLEPIFKTGKVWCQRYQKKFVDQFESYPAGFVDTLDTLGFFPSQLNVTGSAKLKEFMQRQQAQFVGYGG